MTRRNDELTAALAPLLTVESGWSEDPMTVLLALTRQARGIVPHLEKTQPGALNSLRYWHFVAEECERLRDRIGEQWRA
jgi:hypothetical protein